MDLVDEQDRFLSVHTEAVLRLFYNFFHIFLSGNCRVDLGKACTGRVCDDLCKGGLTGSGRSVEDDGSQFIGFDRTIQ